LLEGKSMMHCEVFNLGTGKGITVLEAINTFEQSTGIKLNYTIGERREGDVIAIFANNDKAKSVLNWEAKYTLPEIMLSAWEWEKALQDNPIIP
jgi:UDP-glucose 4-epimerase